jgi:hypothetical protein
MSLAEKGGGLHEGLVGDEDTGCACAVEGLLRGVCPVSHVPLVHPRVHLCVERGVVQGQIRVERARTPGEALLLDVGIEVEVDCSGEGHAEYECESAQELPTHVLGSTLVYSKHVDCL